MLVDTIRTYGVVFRLHGENRCSPLDDLAYNPNNIAQTVIREALAPHRTAIGKSHKWLAFQVSLVSGDWGNLSWHGPSPEEATLPEVNDYLW